VTDRATPHVVSIRGERVALGPVTTELRAPLYRWLNDMASFRTLGADPAPATSARAGDLIDLVGDDPSRVTFVIYDLADMAPIGTTSVTHIDHRNQTCEIDLAIMEPDWRGQGLGSETVRLMTDYAIHALGMHNVHLRVYAFNHAGIRAYRKAGYREYGRRREAWLHNGKRWDIVFMEVLATEWDRPPRTDGPQ
jgi:RimJ/RimL family protein N-acetyltransferase